jgi:hypothetical protein
LQNSKHEIELINHKRDISSHDMNKEI